jgi:hypothetical protein
MQYHIAVCLLAMKTTDLDEVMLFYACFLKLINSKRINPTLDPHMASLISRLAVSGRSLLGKDTLGLGLTMLSLVI